MASSPKEKGIESALSKTVSLCSSHAIRAREASLLEVADSQVALSKQLNVLLEEMSRVNSAIDGLSLDPETSSYLNTARDSLQQSRARLIKVRGRLGRLRGFEESQRLRLANPPETEMHSVGGQSSTKGAAHAVDGPGEHDGADKPVETQLSSRNSSNPSETLPSVWRKPNGPEIAKLEEP